MIIDTIQEWFKEVLIDGIISNLSGTFDTVNTKVAEIAGEVGMTPSGWNGGIFNMIRSLSDTVIVPIADRRGTVHPAGGRDGCRVSLPRRGGRDVEHGHL